LIIIKLRFICYVDEEGKKFSGVANRCTKCGTETSLTCNVRAIPDEGVLYAFCSKCFSKLKEMPEEGEDN